jgi:hypothetical protein
MWRLGCLIIMVSALSSGEAVAQLTNHAEIGPGIYFELWKAPPPASPGTQSTGGWGNTNLFEAGEMLYYVISGTRTQIVGRLPPAQLFALELRDAGGNPVPKTGLGRDNSKPVDLNKKPPRDLEVKLGGVSPTKVLFREAFRPKDYFVITNKGVYTLQAQIRVWTRITNGQYGVVVSQPVRVHVEKH